MSSRWTAAGCVVALALGLAIGGCSGHSGPSASSTTSTTNHPVASSTTTVPVSVSCGADDEPENGFNLDYINESGTSCAIAHELALAVVNGPYNGVYGTPFVVNGYSCVAEPGPTDGQGFDLDHCTRAGAMVDFKSRTP
jgi:hypothetical protein